MHNAPCQALINSYRYMKNSSGRNMPECDGRITPTGTSEVIYFTISFFVLHIGCKSNVFSVFILLESWKLYQTVLNCKICLL